MATSGATKPTGVCVVRAEVQPSQRFLISVTTNVDIAGGARIELHKSAHRLEDAVDIVAHFLRAWAMEAAFRGPDAPDEVGPRE
jgi:hypothetical protein